MKNINMNDIVTVKQLIEIAANMKDLAIYYRNESKISLSKLYDERLQCIRDILNDELGYDFSSIDYCIDSRYDELTAY